MSLYLKFWTHYFDFNGISKRSEYWLDMVMNWIVNFVVSFVCGFIIGLTGSGTIMLTVWGFLFYFAVLIPKLALIYRRINDCGFGDSGNRVAKIVMTIIFALGMFSIFMFSFTAAIHVFNLFLGFIYFIGFIVLGCIPSHNLNNRRYGTYNQNPY